jgi:hypothetical protein
MRSPYRRLVAIARLTVATLVALAIATPASAQFGGLKKKLKPKVGQEGSSRASDKDYEPPTEDAAAGAPGGTIVLTEDVVSQLLAGLKAGQVEREAASKEDTPYGRYKKAEAAYAVAQPKCEAAQQTLPQRATQKMSEKMNALNQKMLAAQSKHDYKLMEIYQDSVKAMIDPSCVVKNPEQPRDFYQAQREIDTRAEQQEAKVSGFTPVELAMVKERAIAILNGSAPPGDASPSEKSAVSAKASELKPLLGFPEEPAHKSITVERPAPAPTPTPPQADPQMSAAASRMNDCMMKNLQSHQAEIEALGKRAQAAQAAKDQAKLMAIADTLQQIQMAGCR